ncbi:DUF2325 domain-containing protein [Variovorax sp. J22R133]|uniref:DUF2325 domain-containing protein n=1 Tax=Variovorax brevis TaxID=3053503 RepID=UPI002577FAAE|nr:DUF2325 domain-containing protein [Variovorax sp. J22R133]MDM0113842.1 DUF2325 domain-containing protein [Variovorax sp. J22R133]
MSASFNLNLSRTSGFGSGPVSSAYRLVSCCEDDVEDTDFGNKGRARLQQLNPHVHCSIIGTCLSTAELRKIVGKYGDIDVAHASDVEVHHEGVSIASSTLGGKALTKALDKRHEAVIRVYSKAKDANALTALWLQSLRGGEIPGAYWALMSHRHVTAELRQRAFGDVHMLSHLVGAANRADIRRLAALEQEKAALQEHADRLQEHVAKLLDESQHLRRNVELLEAESAVARVRPVEKPADTESLQRDLQAQIQLTALQTQRREAAEQALAASASNEEQLQVELDCSRRLNDTLRRELQGAESHLQRLASSDGGQTDALLQQAIRGHKILYVGGRPSSTPAIRKLVVDSGGEFVHHDGGMEDRKGLLASALVGAHVVVFPVDCVDHDSVNHLKRLCARHNVPFLPLRTASATCFAAALMTAAAEEAPAKPAFRMCLRHG